MGEERGTESERDTPVLKVEESLYFNLKKTVAWFYLSNIFVNALKTFMFQVKQDYFNGDGH